MSYLLTAPEMLATAAADIDGISQALSTAHAAAARPTTSLVSMAGDEVSALVARLFSGHGRLFQEASARAAAFHEEFVRALAATATWYADTEAANGLTLSTGTTGTGTGTGTGTTISMPALKSLGSPLVGFYLGGSGQPVPGSDYVNLNNTLYVGPLYPGNLARALDYPASFYPLTGVKSLSVNTSIAQGATIVKNAILQQIQAGNNVVVFGDSQSSLVAGVAMQQLSALTNAPTTSQLAFVLVGDPGNPNGGLAERYDGLSLPALGLTFLGATPDNLYPTHVYTLEYDGFADFPQYPINLPSDLNALLGTIYVHTQYQNISSMQIINALPLTTQGTTLTDYYMIPTQNLPLLEPLRGIPYVGNPLADLLQPDLTTIVNLGYGNPDYGWSQGPANVATPLGLFPHVSQAAICRDLIHGAQQGFNAAVGDFKAEGLPSLSSLPLSGLPARDPAAWSLSSSAMVLSDLSHVTAVNPVTALSTSITGLADLPTTIVNNLETALSPASIANWASNLSNSIANGTSLLLPTADLLLSAVITLPSYDLNLFLDGIEQVLNGNPVGFVNAIGYPLAADTGLATLGLAAEVLVIGNAFGAFNGIE